MGMGVAGLIAGFGRAAKEHNTKVMDLELASRQGIAQMWQALAENENLPPEIRQGAIENLIGVYSSLTELGKPLKKQFSDIDALARLNPIPPPALPAPEGVPAGGRTGAPTPPEGQLAIPPGVQAAMGVSAPGGQPMGIPPPAMGPPPSPEALPEPARAGSSLFYGPSQIMALQRMQAEAETATEKNRIQDLLKIGVIPSEVRRDVIPPPVPIGPRGLATRGRQGEITGFIEPPEIPEELPTAGSFEDFMVNKTRIFERSEGRKPTPEEYEDLTKTGRREFAVGSFSPIVDERGNITGFINASTGAIVGPPSMPGGGQARRAPVSSGELEERGALEVMLEDTDRLLHYAQQNKHAIGTVMGRGYGAARGFVDVGEGVNRMFRIAENLTDLLVRARSGAQINENELKRLQAVMPDPKGPEGKFFTDLSEFRSEIKRIFEKRSGRTYKALEYLDGSFWRELPDGTMEEIGP